MAKEPYNVTILVTDSQGNDVFLFESHTFKEKDLDSLQSFLLPDMDMLENSDIKDFPNED